MEQAKERWGEAEIITFVEEGEEQQLRHLQSNEGQYGNRGSSPLILNHRFRDTKKQVDLQKRKAKRKKSRKSRKAA